MTVEQKKWELIVGSEISDKFFEFIAESIYTHNQHTLPELMDHLWHLVAVGMFLTTKDLDDYPDTETFMAAKEEIRALFEEAVRNCKRDHPCLN